MRIARSNHSSRRRGGRSGFTLVELLVVIVIIGLLATITLPALKGFGRGTIIKGAQRQILDDLALARQKAIVERSTVYMIFVPPELTAELSTMNANNPAYDNLVDLADDRFTSYALYTKRGVGAQPGQLQPRYLTEWRALPDGMLFAPYKLKIPQSWDVADRPPQWLINTRGKEYSEPLPRTRLRFPTEDYLPQTIDVPYIAFNSRGQLTTAHDLILPLGEGSVFYPRDAAGNVIPNAPADVQLTPVFNYTNNFIRINWLTGRARIEQPELP